MLSARVISAAFLLVSVAWIIPANIEAASPSGLQVSPAYVDVSLPQIASQQEIPITYYNTSNEVLVLELFPIDFRQTSPYGQIGFLGKEAGEYSYSLSSFLSFETNRLELAPGERKTMTVVARNRKDLTPGGHYAAVVARMVQQIGETPTVSPAVSSLIYLRKVGGERFNLSLKEVSWPEHTIVFSIPTTLTLLFQNEGNIHLIPYGEVTVTDLFGRKVLDGVVNEGSVRILPESRRYVPVYLQQHAFHFPLSVYFLTIKGRDSLGEVTYNFSDTFIYIHPLMGSLPFILIGLWLVIRRKRKKKEVVPSVAVVSPQTKGPLNKSDATKRSRKRGTKK